MTVKTNSIEAKVISQRLFFLRDKNEWANVPTVEIEPDYVGYYYIRAKGNEEPVTNWRKYWEEMEIVKVADSLYHIKLYDMSAPRFNLRSDEPFLVLEMTKDEVCEWHSKDVWFSGEYHYIVRRAGKKIYGAENNRRCIKCQYLQRNDATECDRGC